MNVNIVTVFLWLMFYSFAGWLYESALCSITERKLVNRGFLTGPFCPIYGFGALLTIFLLRDSGDASIIALFLAGATLTSILEYATSWVMEKLFQTRWWDYSKFPFNINGRIALHGAIAFGAMSVVLLRFIHPIVAAFIDKIPAFWQIAIFITFLIIFLSDLFVTVKSILSLNNRLQEIQNAINLEKAKNEQRLEGLKLNIIERNADLKEFLSEYRLTITQGMSERSELLANKLESSEFYSERIKHLATQQKFNERRLLKAFPKMQSLKNSDALINLKKILTKKRGSKEGKNNDENL